MMMSVIDPICTPDKTSVVHHRTQNCFNDPSPSYSDRKLSLQEAYFDGSSNKFYDTSPDGNKNNFDVFGATRCAKGVSFDGIDDYCVCENMSDANFSGYDNFSLSCWFYYRGYNNQGSYHNSLFCKGMMAPAGTGFWGLFGSRYNDLRFYADNEFVTIGNSYQDKWTHILMFKEDADVGCYINNVFIGSYMSETDLLGDSNFYLGRDGSTVRYADVTLSDMRLYTNSYLSTDQKTWLYESTRAYYGK